MASADGLMGPRTHFSIELFQAQDDVDALRALARREFERRLSAENLIAAHWEVCGWDPLGLHDD